MNETNITNFVDALNAHDKSANEHRIADEKARNSIAFVVLFVAIVFIGANRNKFYFHGFCYRRNGTILPSVEL